MTTYRRKQADTIEALQFTADMGEVIRDGFVHPGLEYSEHGGYSYHGARIAFGDYMVGRSVVTREAFERDWEPTSLTEEQVARLSVAVEKRDKAIAEQERRIIEDRIAQTGSTGSVAVDTVLASKPSRRSKRDESGEA